jgi:hypothetical protein
MPKTGITGDDQAAFLLHFFKYQPVIAGFAPFLFVLVQHGLDYTPQPNDDKVSPLGR